MFESSGILNEEIGQEFLKISMSRGYRKFIKIYSLVCFLLAVVNIIFLVLSSMKIYLVYAIILIIAAFFLIFAISMFLGKVQITYIDSIKEISDKGEFEFKVFFNDNGVNINNLTTSATFEIKYEFFSRLEETTSMYVLFTKCGQYALVFKNCLNDEEINSFKEFIKEKCKNIKW